MGGFESFPFWRFGKSLYRTGLDFLYYMAGLTRRETGDWGLDIGYAVGVRSVGCEKVPWWDHKSREPE